MITELFTPSQITNASATNSITKDTEARGMKGFRIWNLSSWFYDVMDTEMMRVGMAQPWFFTQGSFERDLTYLRFSSSITLPSLDLPAIPTTQRYVYVELTAEPLPYFTYGLVPGANPGGGTGSPGYSRIQDGTGATLATVGTLDSDFAGANGLAVAAVMSAHQAGGPNRLFTADGLADGRSGSREIAVDLGLFNESTFDRQRGNTQGALLASAARTALTLTANQTNFNARGVILFLNIIAASGTGGLNPRILAIDPVSGYAVYLTPTVTPIITTGIYAITCYPGDSLAGAAGAGNVVSSATRALPRIWYAQIGVGDTSSYTYSLGYAYIL